MSMNVQPIIVDNGYAIIDLLNQVNNALRNGGLAWVERAVARGNKSPDRFVEMAKEEWQES
jgi:nitrogen fixation protein NifX